MAENSHFIMLCSFKFQHLAWFPILILCFFRVTDGTIRYVAEENIDQERLESADELSLLAGKYFKRYSRTDGMFVSNIEDEYPDG